MSIEDATKIDIIASRPGSSEVRLVISDHLGWNDVEGHARLIQAKINTYLAFVETGQIRRVREPRIPDQPEVTIVLAVQHPPSEAAMSFLESVRTFLQGAGFGFEVEERG